MRAFRFEVLNEPKPGQATLSPFIADEMTRSKNSAIVRSASAFDTPAFCDTASINSALVISLPYFPGYGLPLNIYLSRFENKLQAPDAIYDFPCHPIQNFDETQKFQKNNRARQIFPSNCLVAERAATNNRKNATPHKTHTT
jgi:hypothetical protein